MKSGLKWKTEPMKYLIHAFCISCMWKHPIGWGLHKYFVQLSFSSVSCDVGLPGGLGHPIVKLWLIVLVRVLQGHIVEPRRSWFLRNRFPG